MLDTDTKRRIDTARDILVGKVPDPKSQVEQITIALIYKFMDDMDAESEEMGGKRKFFAGEFARYGWAKLMRSGLGGHETLNLYAEAIAKMPENPGVPKLFRDIFKNAYLPYRDPETLKGFLKIIDEFSYDHSERLGDAFEYLLSVLGSQGDAGQFRTPRHIIDFMVEILAPKKNETVLDPACGTAGFLISAYKHILRANTDAKGNSKLTPDEKGVLAKNFTGYDISPDMVRLSLVNLYLHGFADPHIYEYDTLTSEERWNEFADVILANPPFMSPKGGIKPHKRFSIQAKRSEVLFVDYMAEHLTPKGRAAIIVPEGIIFQSQTAYTQLRKMLVENSLVAVVSLPAGVFNPYSGVKTSILILDKSLARQSDTVAFFKVENDGFGLGAQRRSIDKNDLPQVQTELGAYLQALRSKTPTETILSLVTTAQIVSKEKIAANRDYNLSGERYREGVVRFSTFPMVALEQVFTRIGNGVNVIQVDEKSKYRVSRIQTIAEGSVNLEKTKFTNNEVRPESFLHFGDILLSHINSFDHLGKTAIFLENADDVIHGINLIRLVPDKLHIDPHYAIRVFKTARFIDTVKSFAQKAVNQASVKTTDLRAIQIPLPPLEIQKEIVSEIEGYQKVIDGARAVVDNYRPHIPVDPSWPMVELGDVFNITSSKRVFESEWQQQGVPFFRAREIVKLAEQGFVDNKLFISEKMFSEYSSKFGAPCVGDMVVTAVGTLGVCYVVRNGDRFYFKDGNIIWFRKKTENETAFVKYMFQTDIVRKQIDRTPGAVIGTFTIVNAKKTKIPLPSVATQQAIVAEIEAEQALVNASRELIVRMEKKIQGVLARVWGDANLEQGGVES